MKKRTESLIASAMLVGAIVSALLCTVAGEMMHGGWLATRLWAMSILTAPLAALAWPARRLPAGRVIAIIATAINAITDIAFIVMTTNTPRANIDEMFSYFGAAAPIAITLWLVWQVVGAAALIR